LTALVVARGVQGLGAAMVYGTSLQRFSRVLIPYSVAAV
jgi:hypothetical protein